MFLASGELDRSEDWVFISVSQVIVEQMGVDKRFRQSDRVGPILDSRHSTVRATEHPAVGPDRSSVPVSPAREASAADMKFSPPSN